ncbi:MAG: SO2930 family diheme c-type cytochrome [Isosphaeraceae bacterium]
MKPNHGNPLRSSLFLLLLGLPSLAGCGGTAPGPAAAPAPRPVSASSSADTGEPPEKLSAFGLFRGNPADQQPAEGVISYDLNTPLFTDYTLKFRFIKLPPGAHATYHAEDAFDFPVGTVIAKTFAYPTDARDSSRGRRLIETRILRREASGWMGLPYLWNDAQTEATLEVAGGTVDVSWIHTDGKTRKNNYIIPNSNQCKGCHITGDTVTPIGPKARHLNRDFAYATGAENQLEHWTKAGALVGAPAHTAAPRLAVWDDPRSGTLDERARAWLEVNCAHCHNPQGPAKNSGLDLLASQKNPTAYGFMKAPVAAGRGSGGLEFDIVPGHPEKSILAYRINSTDAGIMMPELGKRLVHEEGLALVREWIAAMDDPSKAAAPAASASSTSPGSAALGAVDGDRFSTLPATLWKGKPGERAWWWQVSFPEPRRIGTILQVHGDHEYALKNAPRGYVWQATRDGQAWEDLPETVTANERRMFRIHRLKNPVNARGLRLAIASADGEAPVLREVEFQADPRAEIAFPPWAVIVSTTGSAEVPGEGASSFRKLARSCRGWEQLQFQNAWLGDFRAGFLADEPRPLAAFLSGNFIDWCQQDREHWKGTAEVLRRASLPMWASCGGAQGLAILAETGVEKPWDCPQCRDPAHPKLPIYGHIRGSTRVKCGDYSGCVFERGPMAIRRLSDDPVFRGLPEEFLAMESHCGQIEWPPAGWELIATCGRDGKTKTQCLKLKDRPIYAAQFHIEMEGTPDTSRTIMSNFLDLARRANAAREGPVPNDRISRRPRHDAGIGADRAAGL